MNGKKFPEETKFLSLFEEGWRYLRCNRLKPTDYLVLFCLLEHLDVENWIHMSQKLIGETIGVDSSHVCHSIKRLTELEIIEPKEDPFNKRRLIYRLNPALGWKGSADKWFKCMLELSVQPNSKVKPPAIFGELLDNNQVE